MYGWIKLFADGTKEVGTDYDVSRKKASWSRGRLEGMVGAEIIHGNKSIAIYAPGVFWQSDDYEITVHPNSKPELKVRRLQKQIEKMDYLHFNINPDKDCGKWLTIELDITTGKSSWSVQETKI